MIKFYVVFIISVLIGLNVNAQIVKNHTLQDINNNKVSLYDLKGDKITILDFWTTFCAPCKKAIPELNQIYSDYKEEGVQVIGVNCDGPRTVAKVPSMSQALQIQYPVLVDINSDIFNSLNLSAYPTLIIFDKKNKIKYMHEGFIQGDEETIIKAIKKQLAK